MPIYDTFETENYSAYSGSYNARLFYGDFFSQYSNYERAVVADRVSGIINSAFYKLGYTFLAGNAVNIVSGAYIGHGVRFMTLGCANEVYADSQMSSPLYYTQTNGGVPVIDERPWSGSALFNIPNIHYTGSAMILFGYNNIQLQSNPGGIDLVDYTWQCSFPFMSRYKGLTRFNAPSYRIPYPIVSTVSYSYDAANSFEDSVALTTSRLGRLFVVTPGLLNVVMDQLHVTGTLDYFGSTFGPIMRDRGQLEQPTSETTNKTYFGVGLGPGGIVTTGFRQKQTGIVRTVVAPQVRGWKYGIFNANQKNSTMVLRPGHHGYLRDILEQRVNTKYFDLSEGRMLEGPVRMTPVSGTTLWEQCLDYVTETTPAYNPRDSGAWDYEYRSGQPFFDLERI